MPQLLIADTRVDDGIPLTVDNMPAFGRGLTTLVMSVLLDRDSAELLIQVHWQMHLLY